MNYLLETERIISNVAFRLDLNMNVNECHSLKKKILQKTEIIKGKQNQSNSDNIIAFTATWTKI